jgi:glycosyltransferase involved in cell wall biosynthesis
VIPNGVDLSMFTPTSAAEARRALGWSEARPNVLFVGNPELPRKNFKLAEAVCAELARRGRPVRLRIGWDIPPRQMPVWMSAADALLFPSLSEGSPNAIKEAMAVECPIVSAPVGDVPERLAGIAGTSVVERDPHAMADAVIRALEHGRATGARAAVEELSAERVGERVLAVYRAAIS